MPGTQMVQRYRCRKVATIGPGPGAGPDLGCSFTVNEGYTLLDFSNGEGSAQELPISLSLYSFVCGRDTVLVLGCLRA